MKKTVRKKSVALLLSLALLLTTMPCVPTAAAEEIAVTPTSQTLTETTEAHTLSTEQEEIFASALTADCGILSYVDEEVFESGNHVLRLPEEETLSTYVFLNSDGTKTVYYMDENVKFVDSDGNIHEKDLTLTSMVGGYTTTQNDIQLSLPTDPANGISLTHNGYTVSLTPQGGTLSTPVQLSGNSVCYPNYFAPASILVYTPTLSGLKEEIVLVKYAGVHTFSFLLNTDGLHLYQENGRYYLSESSSGQTRIDLGDLVTFDATGRFGVGTMTAETVIAGQTYRLSLEVDEEFLTDSNTTYPVTVDPELTVSDNTHGAGAIEDVSIYQGKPTTNGNWTYLHSGYYDSTYGVARTLIRLTGLINDSTWQGLAAGQITSASFFIYEATGTNGPLVSLCANAGSSTWTESGATWSNAGAVVGTAYNTQTPASNAYAEYNITSLLKAWKTGDANAAAGFILKSSNETDTDKAFLSSEYSTTTKRPYVTVTYEEIEGEVNITASKNDVDRGGSLTLSAITSPSGQSVTWTSSNTAIASVNENGLVSGYKAGTVTITAELENGNSDTFVVYVTVADGIYYIRNAATDYHLTSSTTLGTTAYSSINNLYTDYANQARQVWKIRYIDSGYYTVRPLYTVSGCLTAASNGYAIVQNNPNENTLASVSTLARWRIDENSFGFAFKNLGSDARTLKPAEPSTAPGTNVIIGAWESTLKSHWALEWVDRVYLRDETTGHPATASTIKYMEVGEQKTCDALGFELETYGKQATLSWTSSNEAVATVSQEGTVAALSSGETIITLTSTLDGQSYSQSFTVTVYVYIPDGTYYIRNWHSDKYIDTYDQTITDSSLVCQYSYHGGSTQKWVITHQGDGSYTIRSAESSNYYITLDSTATNGGEFVIAPSNSVTDELKWDINIAASGAYMLMPHTSASNTVLAVDYNTSHANAVPIVQMSHTDDTRHNDEWLLCRAETVVVLEPQETNVWCWVACARMASMNYMDSQISQSSAAVFVKNNIRTLIPSSVEIAASTDGGTNEEIVSAINYLTGSDVASFAELRIYSENTIRSLIDSGNIIILSRAEYTAPLVRDMGHATVLYDYSYDDTLGVYRYHIFDPWLGGSDYERSYSWICNGNNAILPEEEDLVDSRVWDGFVVLKLGDYQNSIAISLQP